MQRAAKDAIYLHMTLKMGRVATAQATVNNVQEIYAFHVTEGINLIQRANVLILVPGCIFCDQNNP